MKGARWLNGFYWHKNCALVTGELEFLWYLSCKFCMPYGPPGAHRPKWKEYNGGYIEAGTLPETTRYIQEACVYYSVTDEATVCCSQCNFLVNETCIAEIQLIVTSTSAGAGVYIHLYIYVSCGFSSATLCNAKVCAMQSALSFI